LYYTHKTGGGGDNPENISQREDKYIRWEENPKDPRRGLEGNTSTKQEREARTSYRCGVKGRLTKGNCQDGSAKKNGMTYGGEVREERKSWVFQFLEKTSKGPGGGQVKRERKKPCHQKKEGKLNKGTRESKMFNEKNALSLPETADRTDKAEGRQ